MTERDGYAAADGDEAVARGLTGLAEGFEIGPVPYDRVVAGGRRRLLRRRSAAVGALALAVVAVAGGVAALGPDGPGRASVVQAAGGSPAVAPSAAPTATATVTAGAAATATAGATATVTAGTRDPFAPVRVQLAQGSSNGRAWTAWAALWPAAAKDQAYRQAGLVWQDRHAAGSDVPEPTEESVRQYWQEGQDVVNLYVTLDGRRLPVDSEHTVASPQGRPADGTDPHGNLSGSAIGPRNKGGTDGPMLGAPDLVLVKVGGDAARMVAAWPDGTTFEPPLVTVGDSPVRWAAIPRRAERPGGEITVYGADGALLATNTSWLA
ncbi:hypothetical protein ACFVVX_03600 [Kitasatospora sp. NPDC058170]|uniref:hypothetical protein n=1 Tax=Kitasatospora sp. NPDC058170 TaxID=3346364 RepID=UPI0036DABB50